MSQRASSGGISPFLSEPIVFVSVPSGFLFSVLVLTLGTGAGSVPAFNLISPRVMFFDVFFF